MATATTTTPTVAWKRCNLRDGNICQRLACERPRRPWKERERNEQNRTLMDRGKGREGKNIKTTNTSERRVQYHIDGAEYCVLPVVSHIKGIFVFVLS